MAGARSRPHHTSFEANCLSKRVWATRAKAAGFCLWAYRKFGGELEPYKCPMCGSWHTTGKKRGKEVVQ